MHISFQLLFPPQVYNLVWRFRRQVYEDTLDGVYLLLKREMQERLVEHERFWHVAKVQMSRVCALEETAVNYVNWRMIETLPYYK